MTAEVIKKSQGVGKEIQEAKQQLLSGVCPINVDQVKFKFHGEFVERIQQVDEAIQELDWVTESRQAGIKSGALAAGLAAALLVGSISIALGAEIKSDTAIGDGWNVVAGGLLALLCYRRVFCVSLGVLYEQIVERGMDKQEDQNRS